MEGANAEDVKPGPHKRKIARRLERKCMMAKLKQVEDRVEARRE
jgi:hypothetical protein